MSAQMTCRGRTSLTGDVRDAHAKADAPEPHTTERDCSSSAATQIGQPGSTSTMEAEVMAE